MIRDRSSDGDDSLGTGPRDFRGYRNAVGCPPGDGSLRPNGALLIQPRAQPQSGGALGNVAQEFVEPQRGGLIGSRTPRADSRPAAAPQPSDRSWPATSAGGSSSRPADRVIASASLVRLAPAEAATRRQAATAIVAPHGVVASAGAKPDGEPARARGQPGQRKIGELERSALARICSKRSIGPHWPCADGA